jgi:YHS domain-containing protein
MAWLEQNWINILLVIGLIFMMRRGGMGCGPRAGRHHHGESNESAPHPEFESNIDPVSMQTVDPQTAVTSVYQGRIYYFASRENRDRFETSPEQFAAKSQDKSSKGHGCC